MILDLASVLLQKNKCMFCYPILWLLSGVMPHLQLLALVIPYSGNTKVRCDPVLALIRFT